MAWPMISLLAMASSSWSLSSTGKAWVAGRRPGSNVTDGKIAVPIEEPVGLDHQAIAGFELHALYGGLNLSPGQIRVT